MEIAELEIFRAVAQTSSVTRAAEALNRVQSNVTTRLQQLEDDLGATLFLRDNKRMTLTPQGERFLPYVEQILGLVEQSRQAMHTDQPSGTLRVGAMESAAASRLPQPLARFHAAWPDVQIAIQTGTTQSMVDAVIAHRADCAVVAHPSAGPARDADINVFSPGLQGTFLFSEKLMLVLPPEHAKVKSAADLEIRSLATFSRGCTYRQCAQDWLAVGDDRMAKWNVIELASYHAIMACVLAGTAIAVLPQSVLALHRDAPDVQTVFLRTVHSFLIAREGFQTPAYRAFLRELKRRDPQ